MQNFTKEEFGNIAEYKRIAESYDYSPSEIIHELNMQISDAKYKAFKGCLICLTIYLGLLMLIIAFGARASKLGIIIGAISVIILYWVNPKSRIDIRYFRAIKSTLLITLGSFEIIIKKKNISLNDPIVTRFYEGLMIQGLMAEKEANVFQDKIHDDIHSLYYYMICKIFIMSLEEEGEET